MTVDDREYWSHREFGVGDTVVLAPNVHESEDFLFCDSRGIGTVQPGHVLSAGAQGVVVEVTQGVDEYGEPYKVQGEDGNTYWYEAAHLVAGGADEEEVERATKLRAVEETEQRAAKALAEAEVKLRALEEETKQAAKALAEAEVAVQAKIAQQQGVAQQGLATGRVKQSLTRPYGDPLPRKMGATKLAPGRHGVKEHDDDEPSSPEVDGDTPSLASTRSSATSASNDGAIVGDGARAEQAMGVAQQGMAAAKKEVEAHHKTSSTDYSCFDAIDDSKCDELEEQTCDNQVDSRSEQAAHVAASRDGHGSTNWAVGGDGGGARATALEANTGRPMGVPVTIHDKLCSSQCSHGV